MMILYYARQSCALASHIALEHAGVAYRAKRVDFSMQEQRSPEYLRINPKGRVPSLVAGPWVMGDDFTICDMYLFTIAQWLESDGVDVSRFPRVADHRRRTSERDVVQRVLATELAASAERST